MKPYWYGIGGGKSDDPRMFPHYQRVATIAASRAQRERPLAAILPTAHRNGLHPALKYRDFTLETFQNLGCDTIEILIGDVPKGESPFSHDDVAEVLSIASALFVLGGDTRYLLEICRSQNFTPIFRDAFSSGLPFCGTSAGCIWISRKSMSDSEWFETPDNWSYIMTDGLGFVPLCLNVHDNQGIREGLKPSHSRRKVFERMFLDNGENLAIAIDEFVALELRNSVLKVVGTDFERSAYIIRRSGDEVSREKFTSSMKDVDLDTLVAQGNLTPRPPQNGT